MNNEHTSFNDVMVDIETLSTRPDAAVMSIGACSFNPFTGKLGDTFHMRVAFEDACSNGNVSIDTLKWWIRQDAKAGVDVTSGTDSIGVVLDAFALWLGKRNSILVWGNGATFDITILEAAFERSGINIPWKFYNVRDCRTVEHIATDISNRSEYVRKGIHHNALDDAIYQAEYVSGMCKALRANKPNLRAVEAPIVTNETVETTEDVGSV